MQADPDFLPRSNDFGLNQAVFQETFCSTCPEHFYKIAFLCTDLNPDKRPPFEVTEVWLESLSMHLSVGLQLPSDLIFDIDHYCGQSPASSGSNTPEVCRSPTLEPICEGKTADTNIILNSDNLTPIVKVSSADNLIDGKKQNKLKRILKRPNNNGLSKSYESFNKHCPAVEIKPHDSCTKSCEDFYAVKNHRQYGKLPEKKEKLEREELLLNSKHGERSDKLEKRADTKTISLARKVRYFAWTNYLLISSG